MSWTLYNYNDSEVDMEKVLITGADGLLGSHTVRCALQEGYLVKAFLQAGRNTGTLDGLPIEKVYGDLVNRYDIESALAGCDSIIHTAGSTTVYPSRSQRIWEINYDAVVNLAGLAKQYGVRRLVHIGSASSFGYGTREHPGDETSPFLGKPFKLDYLDTKKAAQDFLLEQFHQNDLPVVILAPTFMVGEFDTAPGAGRMIIAICKHSLPFVPFGGKCVVYAADVARAAVNALKMGNLGESYITGGENLTYQQFYNMIAQLAHVTAPKIKIPTPLAVFLGRFLEMAAKITHKEPMFSSGMARMSGDTHFYTSQKAMHELQMPQTSPRLAIEKAISYFKSFGSL